MFFHPSDINECSADFSVCDENADCNNSDGSYSCTCKQGFTGNGTVCKGNYSADDLDLNVTTADCFLIKFTLLLMYGF